jgi:predicted membrane channel-forming protein YqfA (hemolysin III family)
MLIDIYKEGSVSSAAGKFSVESLKEEKYARCAIFGLATFVCVLVSFIVHASGVKKVRYFTNENEALKWLKEK